MLVALVATVPFDLAALSAARSSFEKRLHEPYGHHVACMMMGAGNEAYFPVGVANRRYLLQLIQGEPHLLFQRLEGSRAKTVWSISLEEGKGPTPAKGTLWRMVSREGYRIKTRRLTRVQRVALTSVKSFAIYNAYGPDAWLGAGFLRNDGSEAGWDVYFSYPGERPEGAPEFRPIVAEEAGALGLDAVRWHGPGPLTFAHIVYPADLAEAKIEHYP